MKSLLIHGFGTSMYVEKRKLTVYNKLDDVREEIYPHKIAYDSIIIDGHTGNITFEAMRWLMKHNINLTLLNWNGQILANTMPEQPKSGKLRIKQYEKYLTSETRFEIASNIVQAKIEHSLNLLEELSKYHEISNIIKIKRLLYKQGITQIHKNLEKQGISKSIRQLMTHEGQIAESYLGIMVEIFNKLNPEFHFTGRKDKANSRNYNASDEINALLNYGYSILESEIRKAINSVGLDYSIGFLHEINQSHTPLVYDLQELFRWLIDLSVIQLLEENKIKKSDFIITENYHTRLRENTATMLIEKINQIFNHRESYKNNKKYSYQNILHDQIQQLANFILGKQNHLELKIPKIKLERNDDLEIKEKILNMTPQQRKELGINKSTLWHMKKNIAQKKRISIYNKVKNKIQEKSIPNMSPKA
jgi:CRISPR-associated protein Cas1